MPIRKILWNNQWGEDVRSDSAEHDRAWGSSVVAFQEKWWGVCAKLPFTGDWLIQVWGVFLAEIWQVLECWKEQHRHVSDVSVWTVLLWRLQWRRNRRPAYIIKVHQRDSALQQDPLLEVWKNATKVRFIKNLRPQSNPFLNTLATVTIAINVAAILHPPRHK